MSRYGPGGYPEQPGDPHQGHQDDQWASGYQQPTDPYQQPTDPYRYASDPYRQAADPYRQEQDSYGQPADPWGHRQQAWTQGQEPRATRGYPAPGPPPPYQPAGYQGAGWEQPPAPEQPPRRRRRTALLTALALALLLLGGAGAAMFLLGDDDGGDQLAGGGEQVDSSASADPGGNGDGGDGDGGDGDGGDGAGEQDRIGLGAVVAEADDCLVNDSTNDDPAMRIVACDTDEDSRVYRVLYRVDVQVTGDTAEEQDSAAHEICGEIDGYEYHYRFVGPTEEDSFVLCMREE